MKTAVIIFLTGLCVWFIAPNLPLPSDVFKARPPSEIVEDTPALQIPLAPAGANFNLIERDVFKFINIERGKEGVSELRWDENLHDMAREHSEWMAAKGTLEHSNYGILENCWRGIGYKPTDLAVMCFVTWRDSPPHHENMLEPSVNYCAVGFAESDQGTFATFIAK